MENGKIPIENMQISRESLASFFIVTLGRGRHHHHIYGGKAAIAVNQQKLTVNVVVMHGRRLPIGAHLNRTRDAIIQSSDNLWV